MKHKLSALLLLICILLTACAPSEDTSQTSDTSSVGEPEQKTVTVTESALVDKIKGAWAGQMAGVVLGAKQEFWYRGKTMPDDQVEDFATLNINDAFYQDDLYVEITYVEQMLKTGYDSTLSQLAEAFKNSTYPLDHANKIGRENLQKGIDAPLSGSYLYNLHCDDIDWQINADFVGQLYPGNPTAAAERAFEIGHITNYGDGVYGGVFVAAMNAAAYTAQSVDEIIDAGYNAIPDGTKFKAILDDVIKCHAEGKTWLECWQVIQDNWADTDRCPWYCHGAENIDAKLNSAYILIGLLYGEGDFIKSMTLAMQCGQDSDCNPSSVGGILGTFYGFNGIPSECVKGLDLTGTLFSTTNLSFNQTVDACVSLMKDSIKDYADKSDEGYIIPVSSVDAAPFEQWEDMPAVTFEATVDEDSVVTLSVNAVDHSDISGFVFDMGDGNVIYASISTYKYAKAGTYTIKLAVTNGNGGTAHHECTVTTTKDFDISVSDNVGVYRNIASEAYPICTVTAPAGTGSKNLETLRDGVVPSVGTYATVKQFDTFNNNISPHTEYIGYVFLTAFNVDKVVFTEGMHFNNGGWFDDGSLKLQLLVKNGDSAEWVTVTSQSTPEYPVGNEQNDFGKSFETYTFEFDKTECLGVRLIGDAGGISHFISVGELEVYGNE